MTEQEDEAWLRANESIACRIIEGEPGRIILRLAGKVVSFSTWGWARYWAQDAMKASGNIARGDGGRD